MKVSIRSSGGFANLGLGGTVDTAALPPEQARRIEAGLAADKLRAAATPPTAARRGLGMVPDATQYEVTIHPEGGGQARTFTVDDAAQAPEVLAAIDELMAEVVRQKEAAPEDG